MTKEQIRETLENQLQLLSIRSQIANLDQDVASLTSEMVNVCQGLIITAKEQVKEQVKETLEKQLQLLSERSRKAALERDLALLSSGMVRVCEVLLFLEADNPGGKKKCVH